MLRNCFERMPIACIVADADFKIIEWNPAAEDLYGYTRAEMLGSDPTHLIVSPESSIDVERIHAEARAGKSQQGLRTVNRTRDGRQIIVEWSSTPLCDPAGRIVAYVGLVQDVTLRVQAEQERDRFFSMSPDMLCLASLDGRFLRVNPAFTRILGFDEKDLLSRHYYDFVHPDERELCRRELATLSAGRHVFGFETRYLCPNGEVRTLAWNCVVGEPGDERIYAVARDVTELRLNEEQARQHQAQSAHVARVTSLGEMAAGLAHEVNQPLYAVANFAEASAELLNRLQAGECSPANVQELLHWNRQIAEQASRAGEVVRRITAFMRKTPVRPALVALSELAAESIALVGAEARRRRIEVHLSAPSELPQALADKILIEQVFVNLLRNAFEAVSENVAEPREVRVFVARTAPDELRASVVDNGPGLDPEGGKRIFEPFFTTKPEGVGMGLAISRSIVESHGGRLWAADHRGRGAAFHFTLPIPPERPPT